MLNKALIITGPTCSGKNDFANFLAEFLDIAIINCDSIQVYKNLNILSNRPSKTEMKDVPHYLYGYIDNKNYNVNEWLSDLKKVIDEINLQKKLPVLVGGTGMYIQSAILGISLIPKTNQEFIVKSHEMLDTYGLEYCINYLNKFYGGSNFPKDKQRVLRRLSFILEYKKPIERYFHKRSNKVLNNPYMIQLFKSRDELHERVDNRLKKMLDIGLVEEVKSISKYNSISKSMLTAHGLPEFLGYIKGHHSIKEATELTSVNTKKYIKRQMTWLNNQSYSNLNDRIYFKKSFPTGIIKNINTYLNNE